MFLIHSFYQAAPKVCMALCRELRKALSLQGIQMSFLILGVLSLYISTSYSFLHIFEEAASGRHFQWIAPLDT